MSSRRDAFEAQALRQAQGFGRSEHRAERPSLGRDPSTGSGGAQRERSNAPRIGRNARRGQSTTELALAMLLIVPCILYAVYVGELFMVGAKAQEAEISAAWDVSAYRFHDYAAGPGTVADRVASRYDQVAASVAARLDADLNDLNSYANSGRRGVSLVSGKAWFQGTPVTCTRRPLLRNGGYLRISEVMPFDALDYAPDPLFPSSGPAGDAQRDTLTRDWLLTCASRLEHVSLWTPRRWNQEMTGTAQPELNPVTGPTVFGGLGSSLNGLNAGAAPSLGMPMLVDDWAVEAPNQAPVEEIALRAADSANPRFYRVAQRVHEAYWPHIANEQLNEDFTFLLGHRWLYGSETDTGQVDVLRLALDTDFARRSRFQLENPADPSDGNLPWYLLPHEDDEKSLPALDAVAARRVSGNYLGHPNASFNQP